MNLCQYSCQLSALCSGYQLRLITDEKLHLAAEGCIIRNTLNRRIKKVKDRDEKQVEYKIYIRSSVTKLTEM